MTLSFDQIPSSGRKAYHAARKRAHARNLPMLTPEDFCEIWERAAGHCELSGLPFSDEKETYPDDSGYSRISAFPWQPSLDQIVPGRGYAPENCSLVCKAVNIGKSSYSNRTFLRWVQAVAARS